MKDLETVIIVMSGGKIIRVCRNFAIARAVGFQWDEDHPDEDSTVFFVERVYGRPTAP